MICAKGTTFPGNTPGSNPDAVGIVEDRKGWLFRTARGRNGGTFSAKPMSRPHAWRMIRRRAAAAGIAAPIGCHTFRATGITAYLANGGALEHAQEMAAHERPRTTRPYDRTKERLTQDEVERIRLLRNLTSFSGAGASYRNVRESRVSGLSPYVSAAAMIDPGWAARFA